MSNFSWRATTFGLCFPALVLAADPAAEVDTCTGRRPHCTHPPASAVSAAAAQTAVPPALFPTNDDACNAPLANCVRPIAHVAPPNARCSAATTPVAVCDVLSRWQTASTEQSRWSSHQREWLRRQAGDNLSAHALDLVVKLTQPIAANALQQEFDWQITARSELACQLVATPRDDAVRLFCRELHIDFDLARGVPAAIQVAPRPTGQGLVIEAAELVTVSFTAAWDGDAAVPPSPSQPASQPTIRFAAGAIEIEAGPPR